MKQLKAELHTHIDIDPKDVGEISYSAKELIDKASKQGFDILAITCHDLVYENIEISKYAQKKDILLIPGAEMTIENKHVLVYGITETERQSIKSFKELVAFKKKKPEILVIAPHPFHYLSSCLGDIVFKYPDLFDAWEHSFFYTKWFNPNKKVLKLAKGKPIVGNSDVHKIEVLGSTYSLISANKSQKSVFNAIKEGKIEVVSTPLKFGKFVRILIKTIFKL